uniref:Uncharacterized protein MANES_02G099900 n=1 Tax=Rhizophora mucronata TaxID=61149 RepID=A0A2P2LGH4_RHIMU
MPPKTEKRPIDVVAIDSSDDEDCVAVAATGDISSSAIPKPPPWQCRTQRPPQSAALSQQVSPEVLSPPIPAYQTLEFRSFWKAGACVVAPIARKSLPQGQLEYARVHPKFLHSNATSHKWAFGGFFFLILFICIFIANLTKGATETFGYPCAYAYVLSYFMLAAIAELLDNAVDEIHNGATFVMVDKIDIVKDNSPALLFQGVLCR